MENIKILFMGTSDYAACILQELINNNYNIIGLVSQPDRPFGRKRELKPTYTKEVALKNNIDVFAYENINNHINEINALNADLIITCAYGQFISTDILFHPRLNSINVHSSLLPKYRGGAPIHHAIINGEEETGNTIQYMEAGMDSGDILAQSKVKIDLTDTVSSLYPRLMVDGATLLLSMLPDFIEGNIIAREQDESLVSYASVISKDMEYITYNKDIKTVYNHMRGLINWPGCYSKLNDKKIKFFKVNFREVNHDKECGYIEIDNKDYFKIYCNNGYIKVYNFQIEGKKAIDFRIYLNGNKLELVNGLVLNKGVN
jgi:methionyl-tRNA formyltransferase